VWDTGFLQSSNSPEHPNAHLRAGAVLCNVTAHLVRLLQYALAFAALLDEAMGAARVRVHANTHC
jgi:hypothetical protein